MAWSVVRTGRSLEETLGEDSSLATSMLATRANEGHPEDHRNALDMKALEKELLGYGVSANGPNVRSAPKLRQSRIKCSKRSLSTI
jgi:hypothetical protein